MQDASQGWGSRRLVFHKQVETRSLPDGTLLLKQLDQATYMALSAAQFEMLQSFDGRKTVRDILHSLLERGDRPDLRLFYQCVGDALDKGVLHDVSRLPDVRAKMSPSRWPLRWPPLVTVLVCAVGFLSGLIPMYRAVAAPTLDLAAWIAVFPLLAAILSLASLASASALRGFGRQVYGLRLRLNRVVPFYAIDDRDAFMGGRGCEAMTALQALAIPFITAGIFYLADWGAGQVASLIAFLALASPLGQTPAHRLITALFRKERARAPWHASAFLDRRLLTHGFRLRSSLVEESYLLMYAVFALCWIGMAIRCGSGLIRTQGPTLVMRLTSAATVGPRLLAALILAALAGLVLAPVIYQLRVLFRNLWRVVRPKFFPAEAGLARHASDDMSEDEIATFLGKTLLFAQLSGGDRKRVAKAMRPLKVPKKTAVIREHEAGEALFVVLSGRVDVLKEDETGTRCTVAELGPGDIVGEIALLEDVPRTATVRTREGARLLSLGRSAFNNLVVAGLGAETVRDTIQVSAFLRHVPMFAGWPDQALLAASKEFAFEDVPQGARLIEQGKSNEYLYLVYEGRFEVRKNGSVEATLSRHDFFGEISLLRDVQATATVTAAEASRCLKLPRRRFVDLISEDFMVGALIESTSQQRSAGGDPC